MGFGNSWFRCSHCWFCGSITNTSPIAVSYKSNGISWDYRRKSQQLGGHPFLHTKLACTWCGNASMCNYTLCSCCPSMDGAFANSASSAEHHRRLLSFCASSARPDLHSKPRPTFLAVSYSSAQLSYTSQLSTQSCKVREGRCCRHSQAPLTLAVAGCQQSSGRGRKWPSCAAMSIARTEGAPGTLRDFKVQPCTWCRETNRMAGNGSCPVVMLFCGILCQDRLLSIWSGILRGFRVQPFTWCRETKRTAGNG